MNANTTTQYADFIASHKMVAECKKISKADEVVTNAAGWVIKLAVDMQRDGNTRTVDWINLWLELADEMAADNVGKKFVEIRQNEDNVYNVPVGRNFVTAQALLKTIQLVAKGWLHGEYVDTDDSGTPESMSKYRKRVQAASKASNHGQSGRAQTESATDNPLVETVQRTCEQIAAAVADLEDTAEQEAARDVLLAVGQAIGEQIKHQGEDNQHAVYDLLQAFNYGLDTYAPEEPELPRVVGQ